MGVLSLLLSLMAAPAVANPNASELVVLILMDATRADHLTSYGYARPTSPNLDALAATGRRFSRAYVNAPWTRPSTVSFLTGLNASRHRTETETSKVPGDVVTLAQRLQRAGWQTLGFCANGNAGSLAGLERGFDVFEDPTRTYPRGARGITYNGLPTGPFIVEHALAYLAAHRQPKTFLFVFLVDPHDPYQAPPELEKLFLGDFSGTPRRHANWEFNNSYPPAERTSMMAVYDAGIRYADQAIGTLLAGLDSQGRLAQATVIVSADHGEGFGEHGFYLHAHHFWDEVIHVPLIIKSPKMGQGVEPRLAQSIDVTATILDLADADASGVAGHSLLRAPPDDAPMISEYNEFGIHRQAITDGRYKVIWQRPADEAWFLRTAKKKEWFPSVVFDHETVSVFDLTTDPQEKRDLAASIPAPAQALLTTLRAFVGASTSRAKTAASRLDPNGSTGP